MITFCSITHFQNFVQLVSAIFWQLSNFRLFQFSPVRLFAAFSAYIGQSELAPYATIIVGARFRTHGRLTPKLTLFASVTRPCLSELPQYFSRITVSPLQMGVMSAK